MIHSIDSLKLLDAVNIEAKKINKRINCLLQVHIAEEETKFGFSSEEVNTLLETIDPGSYKNIAICGLMGIASFTDDNIEIQSEFKSLKLLFNSLKNKYFTHHPEFKEISMGMSGDYDIAIKEGSTILRIGSLIFGERIYSNH
jgi:PLP dependent protein